MYLMSLTSKIIDPIKHLWKSMASHRCPHLSYHYPPLWAHPTLLHQSLKCLNRKFYSKKIVITHGLIGIETATSWPWYSFSSIHSCNSGRRPVWWRRIRKAPLFIFRPCNSSSIPLFSWNSAIPHFSHSKKQDPSAPCSRWKVGKSPQNGRIRANERGVWSPLNCWSNENVWY